MYIITYYILFESNASKYWNCPEEVEFVLAIRLLEILRTILV